MSKSIPLRDPVSPLARDVLALFSEVLADVCFPDIDLAVLESAAEGLRAVQVEAEQLEAKLELARAVVTAQSEVFTAQAQRALAYARVFAEADPEIARRVTEIGQTSSLVAPRPSAGKRRGRPPKMEPAEGLFGTSHPVHETS